MLKIFLIDENLASVSFFVLLVLVTLELIIVIANKLKGNRYKINVLILLFNIVYIYLSSLNPLNFIITLIIVFYWTFYLFVRSQFLDSNDILLQINFYTVLTYLHVFRLHVDANLFIDNIISSIPLLMLTFLACFHFNQYLIHKKNVVSYRNKAIEALKNGEYESSLSHLEKAVQFSEKLGLLKVPDQLNSEFKILKSKIKNQNFENIERTIPKKVDQKTQLIVWFSFVSLFLFLIILGVIL